MNCVLDNGTIKKNCGRAVLATILKTYCGLDAYS